MHNRCNSSEEFSCNEVKQQLRVDKQKLFRKTTLFDASTYRLLARLLPRKAAGLFGDVSALIHPDRFCGTTNGYRLSQQSASRVSLANYTDCPQATLSDKAESFTCSILNNCSFTYSRLTCQHSKHCGDLLQQKSRK